jgi:hypothetical protein
VGFCLTKKNGQRIDLTWVAGKTNNATGGAEGLSANADIMLKVSALAAWGQLQIASTRQPYLKDVIRPHQSLLNSLWVGALRDYSLLRTDPDSDSLATSVSGVGMMSSRLGREVLLPVRISCLQPCVTKLRQ